MKYTKALIIGASASFLMFLILAPIIQFKIAPFNMPPPSAFLTLVGLGKGPWPVLFHFAYGMFWSAAFVFLWQKKGDVWKGMALGLFLWFLLMVFYSPFMGWGFFGYGNAHELDPNDPLYLAKGPDYMMIMLGLHLFYGWMIGWLNPLWNKVETL